MVSDNKQLKKLEQSQLVELLERAYVTIEATEMTADAVQNSLNELLAQTEQKPAVLFSMIRLSLTWAPFSPALNDTIALLGKETTLRRIRAAINAASA